MQGLRSSAGVVHANASHTGGTEGGVGDALQGNQNRIRI